MSQKQLYTGLTDAEVLESRRKNGVNVLTPPEKDPWWKEFLDKFSDPLIIILFSSYVPASHSKSVSKVSATHGFESVSAV